MRENTPPHSKDIEEDDGEEIFFEDDVPPEEEIEEMEEADLGLIPENFESEEWDAEFPKPSMDDFSILTFRRHQGPVFSCDLHPTRDFAVTGGEDDKAYVWDRDTGEVLHEIKGHKDTVIATHFNYDGSYLATGDMAGEIQVFKINDDELKKIWEYSMGDMCWLKWHTAANVLMAGSENGEIYVWKIPSGDCKILPGHGFKCETAELASDGKKLFSGYGDGTVKLWDIKNSSVIFDVSPESPIGHKDCVYGVACDTESPFYMSAGEEGKILFLTNNGPVGAVQSFGPIETVAFCPNTDFKVAASGSLRGQIAIWDYSKQSLRTYCEHPETQDGVTTIKWLPNYSLIVGTVLGSIYVYDGRSGSRKFLLPGHSCEIYEMAFDPKEEILLTASEDHTAKIFRCPTG